MIARFPLPLPEEDKIAMLADEEHLPIGVWWTQLLWREKDFASDKMPLAKILSYRGRIDENSRAKA